MEIGILFVLLLAAAAAQAPAPKEVPITQEPSHHLVLQNQYTRTYQVELPPGAATLLHRHDHDYIFVVLGDADISNEVRGKAAAEQKLKDGDVRFAAGGFAHAARNLASTPFRNVTIEVLRKSVKPICGLNLPGYTSATGPRVCEGESGFIGDGGGYGRFTVLETDAVKVTRIEIDPGHTLRKYRYGDNRMLLALTGLDLRSDVADEGPSAIRHKVGDVVWMKGAAEQTLTNVGKRRARFVIVEFR